MSSDQDPYDSAATAARYLRETLGSHDLAVVLGSGWAEVGTSLGQVRDQLPTARLPGTPVPTVAGHEGTLRSVEVDRDDGSTLRVLVLSGRSHLYEGHGAAAVVHTVRAAVLAGASTIVLTNAAGSLRPEVGVGSTVVISDHLNLTGTDPTIGGPPPAGAHRFTDLSDLYSRELRERLLEARPALPVGVYAGLRGASFETPAEIRMLGHLGADLVGMSTVLEAIAAHQLGASVLGVSLVTNLAAGLQPSVDHGEVLAAGRASAGALVDVLRAALELR